MILRNLDLFEVDPGAFLLFVLITLAGVILAITVHEFSHAMVAFGLGDNTAKRLGRLSLNPLVHLDPMGSAMFLLVGFGWGKPVPVNEWVFGRDSIRSISLVAFAGPLSNFLTATLLAIPFQAGLLEWPFPIDGVLRNFSLEQFVGALLGIFLFYNLLLGVFNLIPLAPLDGSKAILGVLPRESAQSFRRLEPWGPGILLTIIMLDILMGTRILVRVIGPVVNALSTLVAGHSIF